jgi:hypothetical protein
MGLMHEGVHQTQILSKCRVSPLQVGTRPTLLNAAPNSEHFKIVNPQVGLTYFLFMKIFDPLPIVAFPRKYLIAAVFGILFLISPHI